MSATQKFVGDVGLAVERQLFRRVIIRAHGVTHHFELPIEHLLSAHKPSVMRPSAPAPTTRLDLQFMSFIGELQQTGGTGEPSALKTGQ